MNPPRETEASVKEPSSQGRRVRKPVSCSPCRQGKLRCDRALPACGNCVNRGDIASCNYVSRRPRLLQRAESSRQSPDELKNKIDRLEQLVLKFIGSAPDAGKLTSNTVASQSGFEEADCAASPMSFGHEPGAQRESLDELLDDDASGTCAEKNSVIMKIDADYKQSVSIDEAHWAQLLNGIAEVQGYLKTQQTQYEEQTRRISILMRRSPEDPGPTLLFGSTKAVSRSEILAQLPSKYACNTMVGRYFSALDPALYILHGPTFYKQYEAYWNDRGKTSIVWVALLFAILRIAVGDWIREGDEPIEYRGKCHDMAITFRNRLTDCLILADYMQPHEHLIEALLLHLYAEYASNRDCKPSVWVLGGMIVRLAMRMGYHKDTQPLLRNSPFHAEMRRRSWAFVRQADILFSFQIGLPSMIKTSNFDSSLPRNFYDGGEFHDGCKALPPALPDTEPTQISYLITKTRLAFGFARALKEISRVERIPYQRVLEIDRALRDIYATVPGYYQLRNMSEQSEDPLPLIFARFTLANIHHKSLCVVHSRFLEAARTEEKYRYSRRTCLESAIALLRFQAIQNQDLLSEGKVRSLTKYQTSLTIHDYLLAATIISAELCLGVSRGGNSAGETRARCPLGGPTRLEMLTALDISANIFSQMRDKSLEAYKASDVLGMLLKKLQTLDTPPTVSTGVRELLPVAKGDTAKQSRQQSSPSERAEKISRSQPAHYSTTVSGSSALGGAHDQYQGDLHVDRNSDSMNLPASTQPISDYLPTWVTQQRREQSGSTGTPLASSTFPAFYDWPAPSYANEVHTQPIQWDADSLTSMATGAETTSSSLCAPFLDLSDPVSTLWSLNSGNDFMNS